MRLFRFFLILLFLSSSLYSFSPNDREIQFLSGVILLNQKQDLNDSIKVQKFRELQKITGIDSKQAIEFIEKYRNTPEEWKKISDSINKLINTTDTVLKK